MRVVAVSAVGIVCGLGEGASPVGEALRAHRSGAVPLDQLGIGAVVRAPDVPDARGFPDDRKVALLERAVAQAVAGAPDAAPDRRGVFLGTGLSSVTPREVEEDVYPHVRDGRVDRRAATLDLTTDRVAPRRHLPERATAHVARSWGARGPCETVFSACAAGAEAIAAGARAVARGEADVVLAGGHDAMVHPLGLVSFEVLGALTHDVARPFDVRRDGFLLGEGAAVLRLEPLETCAHPLAVILGAGSSLDAHGITAPHPDGAGAEASMRRALADAGLRPDQVGWINAHGTGTPLGDAAEARAIGRLFGDAVPVSSLKGALGHALAAAGALEAVATVIALQQGFLPGTVGCDTPEALGIDVVTAPRSRAPGVVVSNSFGFGGQNCSLVLAREVPSSA